MKYKPLFVIIFIIIPLTAQNVAESKQSSTDEFTKVQAILTPGWDTLIISEDINAVKQYAKDNFKISRKDREVLDSSGIDSLREEKFSEKFQITSVESIREKHPRLWNYFASRKSIKARKSANSKIRLEKGMTKKEFTAYKINKRKEYKKEFIKEYKIILTYLAIKAYNETNPNVRDLIEENEKADSLFVAVKNDIDVARGKYVITPYLPTYGYFHTIKDSAIDGSYVGERLALHWQFSFKYPIWAWRHYDQGIFIFFSNTGCFDLTKSGEKSNPVIKRSFMPGAFIRLDAERILRRFIPYKEIDDEVDIGVYHHSNGGYAELSRSILYLPFISNKLKLVRYNKDKALNKVYSENYMFRIWTRIIPWYPKGKHIEENPGIDTIWGKFEMLCTAEFGFGNEAGFIFWTDAYVSKSTDWFAIGGYPVFFSQRKRSMMKFPLTPYFKFYKGKNEFLEHYDEKRKWWAFGLMLRK